MRLILPLLLIVIAVGLFFGLTTNIFTNIDGLTLQLADAKEDLQDAQDLNDNFSKLNGQVTAISQEKLDQLAVLLPDAIDTVDLLAKINTIAASSSIALADVKIQKTEPRSSSDNTQIAGLGTATFTLSVTGNYQAFRRFLFELERNLRLVDISTISFTSEKEPYQYSVELKTYWLK